MLPPFSAKLPQQVGFPEGLLGPTSWRLPVIWQGDGGALLWKPRGLLAQAHPWYPGKPDVESAIFSQIKAGKPELVDRLKWNWGQVVHALEPEVEGLVLIATDEARAADWRNAVGSNLLRFRFQFLSRAPAEGEGELICQLPIAAHFKEQRGFISHRLGKKAETVFRPVERMGVFGLWEAETAYPRFHQIRLHAAESGIPLWGDELLTTPEQREVLPLFPRRVRRPEGRLPFLSSGLIISPGAGLVEATIETGWSKSNAAFFRALAGA
jgi:tRNA pseudouridine32 synthase/23S rRNA pseudouridine746 synthase